MKKTARRVGMDTLPLNGGTPDAITRDMNAVLQSRVRSIFTREFFRRGQLTWDMKMALQRVIAGR